MSEAGKKIRTQLFAIRTTGGQEINVALMVHVFVESSKRRPQQEGSGSSNNVPEELSEKGVFEGDRGDLDVKAIVVPPGFKGYIILEVPNLHTAYRAVKDIKHVKGRAAGAVSLKDLEKLIKPKPIIEELKEKMLVEIVSGPFKGLRGTIEHIDRNKQEVTVSIAESQFPMTVNMPADFVKPIRSSVTG